MTTPSNIIALAAPVAVQADAKVPTFTATIYTGGELVVGGWDLPVVIDLAGLTRGNVLVANLDHDSTKRVGNFDIENDGRVLKARGTASAATPARDEVVNSAKSGYTWQASVEVQPKRVQSIEAGETVRVNDRTFKGPLYVTRAGVLKGFAFCTHGADDNTTVAIAAQRRNRKMSEFLTWAKQMGVDTHLMTADQLAMLKANHDGRSEPNADDHSSVLPLIQASNDPVVVEARRVKQIEAACHGEWGEHDGRVRELQASAIAGDMPLDNLLSELRTIRSERIMSTIPVSHTVNGGRRDKSPEVIEAAFCLIGGIDKPERFYSEQTLDAADKVRSTIGLQQVILAGAAANGYPLAAGEKITQGNLRRVLQAAFAPAIKATGYSTIDVGTIVGNVANKYLMSGWDSVDQTALRISARKDAKNFHTMTTVSLTGGTSFEKVGPAGELKHGTLGQETYTNQVHTYGEILAITRADIINDDTSALTAVPRKIGRAAMLKLNNLFWTVLLGAESSGFFAGGNGNLNTGAADVTLAGLNKTFADFLAQTDPDGNPLGILPAIMLVPPTQHGAALALMNSQLVVTGASSTLPSGNPWQQRFRVETSPYMEINSYTGSSSAAWYLLADPNQLPTIEIAALNGRVEPTVETADADFSTLGIQMRGYSDVGVALVEYRAAVKADGNAS
jgi:hypothetical protein